MRRYEIDSIRSVALILLIFYHIIISFVPETRAIGFIINKEKDGLVDLLLLLSPALNIWRMPILFLIAGMAFYFSSRRRNNKELFKERLMRLILPLTFCSFFIVPVGYFISENYYNSDFKYWPFPAYLWFLNSIFYYSLFLLPLISLNKKNANLLNFFNKLFKNKYIMFMIFSVPMMIFAAIFNPKDYSNFVNFAALPLLPLGELNIHGFFVGLFCFLIGFIFASSGDIFWNSVRNIKFITLIIAIILFSQRLFFFLIPNWIGDTTAYSLQISNILTAFESVCWMLSFSGFASTFLNKKNNFLSYLTLSVFPIYIFHMPAQFLISSFIYPISIAPTLKFIIVFLTTILLCLAIYEIIKRIRGIKILFGIKT